MNELQQNIIMKRIIHFNYYYEHNKINYMYDEVDAIL